MTLLASSPLNIIMEEDELSSRSPSPSSIKARRRHARITANFDTAFLSPRPAPSPVSSPDSLNLAFPELLEFPFPPTSDLSSSPGAHSSGMPLTPISDSDNEFALPSPRFNPRRAAMQPFVFNFDHERADSDAESDSEFYHNEFSNHLATPSLSHQLQPSRPDSVFIPSDFNVLTSKPKRASITSDTVYPRSRNIKSRISIPKYPPPPVPPIPDHLRSPPAQTHLVISRPPPRSSLPADCVFDSYMDGGDEGDADSDSSSAFSFTMYEVDFGERKCERTASASEGGHVLPQSRNIGLSRHSLESEFAQELEVDLGDARFELDYQLRLPLSIPATPLDLETDIARSFERLREQETVAPEPESKPLPTPPAEEIQIRSASVQKANTSPTHSQDLLYTPSISSFSFSPSPSPVSFSGKHREERALKSKWSSSTLGSIHEEQARDKRGRSTSAKLKFYFGGATSTPPKTSSKSSKRTSSKIIVPPTPTSPLIFRSPPPPSSPPRKTKAHTPSLPPSPIRWPHSRAHKPKRSSTQTHHHHFTPTHQSSYSSDVIIIGYGHGTNLKRRGSNATVSSEGGMSEVSASSSSSSGLRRKPIPIEMFLRNAA